MVLTERPAKANATIAEATFAAHLASALSTARAVRNNWEIVHRVNLVAVVRMWAGQGDDRIPYFLQLEADWYDQWPPRVSFVAPTSDGEWVEATAGTRYLPNITATHPGFALHAAYTFQDQVVRQLICSSVNLDYYWSHEPEVGKVWRQSKNTLMWSLSVVQDELSGEGYKGPSDAADS